MISLLYLTHSYSISLQSVNSLAYHPKWSTLKLNQHFTSRLYVTAMYQIGILNAIGYGREGFYTIRVRYMKGLIYLLDSVSGKDYICCTLFRVSHYYLYFCVCNLIYLWWGLCRTFESHTRQSDVSYLCSTWVWGTDKPTQPRALLSISTEAGRLRLYPASVHESCTGTGYWRRRQGWNSDERLSITQSFEHVSK